jgi:hypothetical protein
MSGARSQEFRSTEEETLFGVRRGLRIHLGWQWMQRPYIFPGPGYLCSCNS